ncbi:hypothetical protein HDZ31DRAFT_40179 [Schizophyllum fasciatum]
MSKKASKAPKTSPTYALGDVVLGKVRGYPSWPGRIVDPNSVPPSVTKERPPGKKATCYCVQFFPKGDYAWLYPKDISKLQKHEIEAHLADPPNAKAKGELNEGYKIALDPEPWAAELAERIQAVTGEDEDEDAENEVDELEGSEGSSDSKSKKRKRESDAGNRKKAAAKKATAKKEAAGGEGKKKAGRKGQTKSKAHVESEDEANPKDAKEEPPAKRKREDDGESDPEAVKFKEWRHKLQKTFLGKTEAKAADMPDIDAILTKIENYGEIPTVALTHSKIGKVMKHIVQLPAAKKPRDDEFHFTERAQKLIDAWNPKGNDAKAAEMTEGTAAMNLNGTATPAAEEDAKGEADADAPAEADNEHVGEESMLADVTMSEAP